MDFVAVSECVAVPAAAPSRRFDSAFQQRASCTPHLIRSAGSHLVPKSTLLAKGFLPLSVSLNVPLARACLAAQSLGSLPSDVLAFVAGELTQRPVVKSGSGGEGPQAETTKSTTTYCAETGK
ncbi:hypothetical protein VTK26DRAFT_193 [Humicola hyalothermophila]